MPTRLVTLVANAAQRVLSENPHRTSFHLKNDTAATDIYWGHDRRVAAAGSFQGGIVDPAGGMYSDWWHKGEVWVIATSAVSITVQEDIGGAPSGLSHT